MIRQASKGFAADESGAVTVDWVVLTAAIVGLTVAIFTLITRESVSVGARVVTDNLVAASEYRRDSTPGDTAPD